MNLVDLFDNTTTTENGALTFKSTLNACLDFFWQAPNANPEKCVELFKSAYSENPQVAIALSFWIRDPREGAGMRDNGRAIFKYIKSKGLITNMDRYMEYVAKYGRWDDTWSLIDSDIEPIATKLMFEVTSGNQLAAKWMPRESSKKNKHIAKRFAKSLGLSMKEYRQAIVSSSSTVEQLMCAKKWDEINFSHVPSQAMRKLRRAFEKHQPERFTEFNQKVESGEATINAATLWPHQILGECIEENFCYWGTQSATKELDKTSENLWKSLPNWVGDNPTLVVADTSGSMQGLPIRVSLSLAIYTAQRLQGPWKDNFITFSETPSWVTFDSNKTMATNIASIPSIVQCTNIQATFELILNRAKSFNLTQEGMPSQVLIISDMQFNTAEAGRTNFELIQEQYKEAGYDMPNIIFWNVNGRFNSTVPVTFNQKGVALVSGYSPSVLKGISTGNFDPMSAMIETLKNYPIEI